MVGTWGPGLPHCSVDPGLVVGVGFGGCCVGGGQLSARPRWTVGHWSLLVAGDW